MSITEGRKAFPEGTKFVHYACAKCGWSPILPRAATPTLWCLLCGEDTTMTAGLEATLDEFLAQGPHLMMPKAEG